MVLCKDIGRAAGVTQVAKIIIIFICKNPVGLGISKRGISKPNETETSAAKREMNQILQQEGSQVNPVQFNATR